MKKTNNLVAWLVVLLVVTGIAYSFGLDATFLLDDFGTLPPMAQWGAIDSLEKLYQFVDGGFAGPTGRPVALLSFLMHGGVWPDDPWDFLLVNILLHLLTAITLFLLLTQLLKRTGQEANFYWLPLLATALWMLHPLHVSAVLYIVQRMTLLSALFSLLSLLAYLYGRSSLQYGRYWLACLGLGAGGISAILAVCSKENAILLPVQFVLLELFIWSCAKNTHHPQNYPLLTRATGISRGVIVVAAIIPAAVVIWYLGSPIAKNAWLLALEGRELGTRRAFTLFERLATQQRVVGDYLIDLAIPKSQTAGVFHDGYPISKSLLQPVSGLVWLLVHGALVGSAIYVRRRMPWLTLGILWFYVGHWVESGSVMLEIKFEHRNYLPSMGLAIAMAALLHKLPVANAYKYGLSLVVCSALLLLLALRSSLWGQPEKAALIWTAENPGSTRALEHAAMVYSAKSDGFEIMERLLREAVRRSDGSAITVLKYYYHMCPTAERMTMDVEELALRLKTDPLDWQAGSVFESILQRMINGQCHFSVEEYQKLLEATKSNRFYQRTRYPMIFKDLEARSELVLGSSERAVQLYLNQNYNKVPLGMIMSQALWMASYQHHADAMEHLRKGINARVNASEFLLEQADDMLKKINADIPAAEKGPWRSGIR